MAHVGSGTLGEGRYSLDARLGTGGMADVYLAYDARLDAWVAVKILKDEFAGKQHWRKRFLQEARVTFQLRHPHIVQVLDVVDDAVAPYIVMELLQGGSLLERVARSGPMSSEEAIDVMLDVCAAVGHAHGRNVIHRDLTPRNCLMDQDGVVKVVDFGIAVIDDEREHSTRVGTDAYMPPEQRLGERVDARADVYALGATLFALLTERMPPNLFRSFVATEVERSLPAPLAKVIVRATQFQPNDRFATVAEMSAALLAARAQVMGLPPMPRPSERDEDMISTRLFDGSMGLGTLIPRDGQDATSVGPRDVSGTLSHGDEVHSWVKGPDEEAGPGKTPRRWRGVGLFILGLGLALVIALGVRWPEAPGPDAAAPAVIGDVEPPGLGGDQGGVEEAGDRPVERGGTPEERGLPSSGGSAAAEGASVAPGDASSSALAHVEVARAGQQALQAGAGGRAKRDAEKAGRPTEVDRKQAGTTVAPAVGGPDTSPGGATNPDASGGDNPASPAPFGRLFVRAPQTFKSVVARQGDKSVRVPLKDNGSSMIGFVSLEPGFWDLFWEFTNGAGGGPKHVEIKFDLMTKIECGAVTGCK
ncbi:MAG TPA: protein kinase [Myxococcota bacterium]|nr:protein kinase [Myxococcota bacterium]